MYISICLSIYLCLSHINHGLIAIIVTKEYELMGPQRGTHFFIRYDEKVSQHVHSQMTVVGPAG